MSVTRGTLARRGEGVRPGLVSGRRGALALVVLWCGTRLLVVLLLLGRHAWVSGDLGYYAESLRAIPEVGLSDTLVEYPLPGVVVVALPWIPVAWLGLPLTYAQLVLAVSLLADAAFAVLLARQSAPAHGGSGRRTAVWVWLLAVPLLGATVYARFDLVPGLLAGAALLLLTRHPRVAAVSAAVATGLKLWPVVVLPALAAPRESRRTLLWVVAGVGASLVAATVALAGVGRVFSPLTWQSERGLQIESVPATPAMVAWFADPGSYEVGYADSKSFEVTGPGVDLLLGVADVGALLLVPGLLLLWITAWRRGAAVTGPAVVWTALAGVTGLMVTSKVLSPQYLLWLLPLAAAGLAVAHTARLRTWAVLLLVATAATQVVFPERYLDVTVHRDGSAIGLSALVLRNALLVWLALSAARNAVRELSAASRSSASPPGPRGTTNAPAGEAPTTPAGPAAG